MASLDDFTPNSALPSYSGGPFDLRAANWEAEVIDFLCINVDCGLIELMHRSEIASQGNVEALRKTLMNGDERNKISKDVLWNVLYFNGTSMLNAMLENSNLRAWNAVAFDPVPDLISKLNNLYENSSESKRK